MLVLVLAWQVPLHNRQKPEANKKTAPDLKPIADTHGFFFFMSFLKFDVCSQYDVCHLPGLRQGGGDGRGKPFFLNSSKVSEIFFRYGNLFGSVAVAPSAWVSV